MVSGLTVACSASQVRDKTLQEASDKTIVVPAFSIAVKLSETAQNKLQTTHESVLVIAYFDGDPLPGKGKDNSPMRGVVLGNDEKLVVTNNLATFSDTKISQGNWNNLSSKNYYVTINVVSARKSSKDNLLDCSDHRPNQHVRRQINTDLLQIDRRAGQPILNLCLTPDKSRYRTCGFGRFYLSGNGVYRGLDNRHTL